MTTKTKLPENFSGPSNASSACPWCLHYEECRDGTPRCHGALDGYDPEDPADDGEVIA